MSLTPYTRLRLHMAGLAHADEVCPLVSSLDRLKVSKWLYVMDRQAGADMLSAQCTVSVLFGHHNGAHGAPATPAIRLRAADPISGVFSGGKLRAIFTPASCGAEAALTSTSKLPRLLFKLTAAVFANESNGGYPPRMLLAKVLALFKTGLIGFGIGHKAIFARMTFALARTVFAAVPVARRDHEGFSAVSTRFRNLCHSHNKSIPPFSGVGSTGYQALKLNRRFVGVELKESYWKTGARNLKRAEEEAATGTLFEGAV